MYQTCLTYYYNLSIECKIFFYVYKIDVNDNNCEEYKRSLKNINNYCYKCDRCARFCKDARYHYFANKIVLKTLSC